MSANVSRRICGAIVLATMLAACGGGSAGSPVAPAAAQRAAATITITIPPGRQTASIRRPAYVSPYTQSVTIVAGTIATTANLTPSSPGCFFNFSVVCTISVNTPVGSAVPFQVTLFDGLNGTGNALATNTVTEAITQAGPNVVALVLNGVVDHIVLSLPAATFGTATSLPVTVNALDAHDNTIISPGGYADANGDPLTITLADSDTSGVTSLSSTAVTSPATNVTLAYTGGGFVTPTISATVTGGSIAGSVTPATLSMAYGGTITEYSNGSVSAPYYITAGTDNAVWFTEYHVDIIGRLSTDGLATFNTYPIPTYLSNTQVIAPGPDGALWFAEYGGPKIGRINTAGIITEYPVTTPPGSNPYGIATGSDGQLWFTQVSTNTVGRVSSGGVFSADIGTPTSGSGPNGIVPGPDGALWFVEFFGNNIGRITTTGAITEYPIPTSNAQPIVITPGPDGALWFAERNTNKIGRITTAGAFTEFTIPTAASAPIGITSGPDGALWFVENATSKIGRITTSGQFTEYSIPSAASGPIDIVAGHDGAMWFTEENTNKIGRLQ